MSEEKRNQPYCNLFSIHCKQEFEVVKAELLSIKKILVGNGDVNGSLMYQATMNTNHRKWMESWGKALLTSSVVAIFAFGGSLVWIVFIHSGGLK